jgi:Domain of unknown function (DUF4157)
VANTNNTGDDPELDALSALPPEELSDELARDIAKRWDPERLLQLVAARAGKGEALDHSLRQRYERRLGIDLGHVRVFSGTFAEEFNRSRGAEAVTIGGTGMILMGNTPERSMATSSGHALLAHELTHVAQAQRGMFNAAKGENMELATEEHEAEAEQAEAQEAHEQQGGQGEHGGGGGDAHAEHAKAGSDKAKADKVEKEVRERVIQMLGDSMRLLHERSGPRWRRP